MIQITPQMRLLLAVEPVDFRKGIDGLVAVCRQGLNTDPIGGAVFIFSNRRRGRLRSSCMTARVFGCARNGFRRGAFMGGPAWAGNRP